MIPTDWEHYIYLMHLLLTNVAFVSVYGVAHVNSINNIIQHENKVTQNHNEQQPR